MSPMLQMSQATSSVANLPPDQPLSQQSPISSAALEWKPILIITWRHYLALALALGVICAALTGWVVWRFGATAVMTITHPSAANIEGLNFGRGRDNLPRFTSQDVFGTYAQTLNMVSNQRAFFDAEILPMLPAPMTAQQQAAAFNKFRLGLHISQPDRSGNIAAKYLAPTALEAETVLSRYLDFTSEVVKKNLFTEARKQIRHAGELQQMALHRDNAFARETIQTELAEARRALTIAHAIKLQEEPKDSSSAKDASALSGTLRYRRGEAALSAEVDTLGRILANPEAVRTGNTASLKEAIMFYQNADDMLERADIKPSLLDAIIVNSKRDAIAPFAALGGMIGFLLGLYLVFAVASRRRAANEQFPQAVSPAN